MHTISLNHSIQYIGHCLRMNILISWAINGKVDKNYNIQRITKQDKIDIILSKSAALEDAQSSF